MTTATTTGASPMLAGLDRAIEVIEEQMQQYEKVETAVKGSIRGETADDAEAYRFDDLEIFAQRLRQIKTWMEHDHDLLKVVDNHISQHARSIERKRARREYTIAAITTVIGAVLGWLLSAAATPMQVLHLLAR
jgi:hypothetical protein